MEKFILINLLLAAMVLSGCSVSKQISKQAKSDVFSNPAFVSAQTGISIYEPATGKYWYNFQGEKYFVPASNTKLPTCYAAMKYLGDSLVAFSYYETGDTLFVTPNGDPTFWILNIPSSRGIIFYQILKNQSLLIHQPGKNNDGAAAGRGMITVIIMLQNEAQCLFMEILYK